MPDFGNPQSLNSYAYAFNNPVKFRDPSGHSVDYGLNCTAEKINPFDPPPPSESEEQSLDALGWRVDVSIGLIVAADFNLDAIWRLPKGLKFDEQGFGFEEPGGVDVFTTPGLQGADVGGGISTGPIVVFNLPSLKDYTGTFLNAGAGGLWESGAEGNVFWSPDPDSDTWGLHFGIGVGAEIFLEGGGGNTQYLEDFYNNTLVPLTNDFTHTFLGGNLLSPQESWYWERGY